MPALGSLVGQAVSHALEPGTVSSYSTAAKRYKKWCLANGMPPYPVSEEKVCYFVVYQALFVGLPTVYKYLSGIRSAQLDMGIAWPETAGWHRFSRVMRFLKKKYGCAVSAPPRRPITTEVLEAFLPTLDLSLHNDRLFFAASCLAVFCFWRGSEFLFSAGSATNHHLLLGQFQWTGSGRNTGVSIRLLHSKTKWWRRDVMTRASSTGTAACPVKAVAAYLSASKLGLSAKSFLFTLADGAPLSRSWMLARTARALADANIDDDRYRSVSWRGGGALSARRAGVSDSVIKMLGRWQSNAFMFYLPATVGELSSAQFALARAKFAGPRGRQGPVLGFSSGSLFGEEELGDVAGMVR